MTCLVFRHILKSFLMLTVVWLGLSALPTSAQPANPDDWSATAPTDTATDSSGGWTGTGEGATCTSGPCLDTSSTGSSASSGGTSTSSSSTPWVNPDGPGGGGGSAGGGWSAGSAALSQFQLPENTAEGVAANVLRWLLILTGLIAVIAFIVSGIMYLTAAGDETRVETAKTAMKWAIVGVIVALAGNVIIQAVIKLLMGISFA